VVLLGEKLTALKGIGALLVLAGAALAQVSLEKASPDGTVPREPSHSR
jgi:drug/metabolite transporter (DMT)-like permease